MDNTVIHPKSASLAHLIDLFVFKGPPKNTDPDHPIQVLVNHGFITGYAPTRLQPLWSAYRIARAGMAVDYDRPHLYYADDRLEPDVRVAPETFGRHDGIAFNVGHMVPNEAINTQFGRLAQLETFLMSNMSPQYDSLNKGIWLKLENKIRNIVDTPQKDHVWAIVGPIFDDQPKMIARRNGQQVPVPAEYYCVFIDPFRYPWDRESNVDIACFRIPQGTHRNEPLEDLLVDLENIETATRLTFVPGWDHDVTTRSEAVTASSAHSSRPESSDVAWERHRILRQL